MIKKILNIGVSNINAESLNRKIRVSNLICFISIIAMTGYIPVAIYFNVIGIIILNILFLISSFFGFYFQYIKKHNLGFYSTSFYGLIYFLFGPIFYGLESNLQFFVIIMCLIAIALFESTLVLRLYITIAVTLFFVLVIQLKNIPGLVHLSEEMKKPQAIISIVNLFILFFITILFFSFFRKENIIFQKAILKQKNIIEEHQKETIDSINYAKRIQYALLANEDLLNKNLKDYFVYFNPKDIVSGDFYWATEYNNKFYLAVCDCTGHGVPGAFMSLLNIGFLNEAIKEKNIAQPNEVLNFIRKRLIDSIGNDGQQDGMDAILICKDKMSNTITYSAANNEPILISVNNLVSNLLELPKDKMPVGKGERTDNFSLHTINYKTGDTLYLYTDGFADQFGGPKGKKFKYKQLNDMLLENTHLTMDNQNIEIKNTFTNWKGNLDQVDDILIIGIRL